MSTDLTTEAHATFEAIRELDDEAGAQAVLALAQKIAAPKPKRTAMDSDTFGGFCIAVWFFLGVVATVMWVGAAQLPHSTINPSHFAGWAVGIGWFIWCGGSGIVALLVFNAWDRRT